MNENEYFSFTPELIQTDLSAKNADEAIEKLSMLLEKKGVVQAGYAELVQEREKSFPTGLRTPGAVIAMPHAFDNRIHTSYVAVGVLKEPVVFQNMEDFEESLNVEIIFLMAIDEKKEQMSMLQVLMKIFQNQTLLTQIKKAKTSTEICHLLNTFLESLKGEKV